jgi:hypothetical protein
MDFDAVRNARTIPPALWPGQRKLQILARNGASAYVPATLGSAASGAIEMPFAVAVLCHPLGTFVALIAAIVATLYALQSQRFLPSFTAVSAALLTTLAFVQVPPSMAGLAWLLAALALLHVEFLRPTFGAAGTLGVGAAAWGSWSLLVPIAPVARGAVALLGALLLLAAVARTMRLRTLPAQLPGAYH